MSSSLLLPSPQSPCSIDFPISSLSLSGLQHMSIQTRTNSVIINSPTSSNHFLSSPHPQVCFWRSCPHTPFHVVPLAPNPGTLGSSLLTTQKQLLLKSLACNPASPRWTTQQHLIHPSLCPAYNSSQDGPPVCPVLRDLPLLKSYFDYIDFLQQSFGREV